MSSNEQKIRTSKRSLILLRFDQTIRNHVKYRSPILRSVKKPEARLWPAGGCVQRIFQPWPEASASSKDGRVSPFFFSFLVAVASPSSLPLLLLAIKDDGNWLKFKVIHFGRKVPSSSLMIAIISHIKAAETSNGKRDWDREWRKAGQASTRASYREIFIQLRRRSTRFWI